MQTSFDPNTGKEVVTGVNYLDVYSSPIDERVIMFLYKIQFIPVLNQMIKERKF